MELSFLVDALKSLLINYTSNNSQIDESLNDLFSSLESKNLNNEIENYAEFILLASSLFELKAKRMLPQEEEIEWMDEVEVLKDKDLAFARLLQFKAFSEIGIALASKIKYNENEIKSFKYYQTKNLFPKPDVEYEINKNKFNEVAIEVFDRFKTIEGFKHIDKDLPDLQKAIDDLLQVVDKRLNTSFESILNEVNTEKEAIAFFLALLEAVRWGFVKASQNDDGIKIEKNYEL
jgi:segregation and condensation protein A|tara:strand:+ start:2921 stop:3622 length:702 start_codon:yes stop_codon:yes gene_type:complete